jgi:hypothetical protein
MPATQSDPMFARSQTQTEMAWKEFLSAMKELERIDDERRVASQRTNVKAQEERHTLLVRQLSVTPFAGRDQGDATPMDAETPRRQHPAPSAFGETKFGMPPVLAADSPFTRRQSSLNVPSSSSSSAASIAANGAVSTNGAFTSLQAPSLMRAASTPGAGLGSLLAASVGSSQSLSSLSTRSGSGGASGSGLAAPRSPQTSTATPSSSPLAYVASLGTQPTSDASSSVGSSFTYVPTTTTAAPVAMQISAASSASITSDGSASSSSTSSSGGTKTPLKSFSSSYPSAGFWSASPAGFRPIGDPLTSSTNGSSSIMSPVRSSIGSPLRVLPLPDRSTVTTSTSTSTSTSVSTILETTISGTNSAFSFTATVSSMSTGTSLVLPPRPIRGRLSGALSEVEASTDAPLPSTSIGTVTRSSSSSGLSTPIRSMTPPIGSSGSTSSGLRAPSPSAMSAPDRDRSPSPSQQQQPLGSARRGRRARQQTPARVRLGLPTVPESIARKTRSAVAAEAKQQREAANNMQQDEDDDDESGGRDDSFVDKRSSSSHRGGLFGDSTSSIRAPSPQVGTSQNAPPGIVLRFIYQTTSSPEVISHCHFIQLWVCRLGTI